MKNPELVNEPLDQKLIDIDEEKKNSHEKYDVTIMTEQFFEALSLRNRTNLDSDESRTSESHQEFHEFRSEQKQMQVPAVPPNLIRYLKAKIETRKTGIQSLRGDLQSMQDVLNSCDEANLNPIQVCPC